MTRIGMKAVLSVGLALFAAVAGCSTPTETVIGDLFPPVDLPAYASVWKETVTDNGTAQPSLTYYLDASNNIVAVELPVAANSQDNQTQVYTNRLVVGKDVTLSKTTATIDGQPVVFYLTYKLVEGKLSATNGQATATIKLYTSASVSTGAPMTSTKTLTGTVANGGATVNFTQSVAHTDPSTGGDVTSSVVDTWVLQSGNALQ